MKLGRKAQCQPSRRMSAKPTATSRTALNGESAPSAKKGSATICAKSATTAIVQATRTRLSRGATGGEL